MTIRVQNEGLILAELAAYQEHTLIGWPVWATAVFIGSLRISIRGGGHGMTLEHYPDDRRLSGENQRRSGTRWELLDTW